MLEDDDELERDFPGREGERPGGLRRGRPVSIEPAVEGVLVYFGCGGVWVCRRHA